LKLCGTNNWLRRRKMIKTTKIWILLTAGLLILSACSSGAGAAATSSVSGSTEASSAAQTELPIQLRLAFGILKLKGTEDEVDSAQAAELLVLWKAVKSLSSSDTTAPEEIQALYEQIQETMTPEQNAAISAMSLSRQDMAQFAQEFGLQFAGNPGAGGNLTPEMQATMEARRASGEGLPAGREGMPAGGPGQGAFMEGGGPPPEFNAGGGGAGGGQSGTGLNRNGMSSSIVDAVIEYLQTRTS
jgi:hypothetical protein